MQVGYLGVGNMGQPMAGKLLDGGHGLVVFDISEAAMEPLLLRQARRAASPKDVGDQCETVVVSLPTLAAFRAAVLGKEGLVAGRALTVVEGALIAPVSDRSLAHLRRLEQFGVPFVLVDRRVPGTQSDVVLGDSIGGARRLVEHLLTLGHRRVGFIVESDDVSTARERRAGYDAALTAAGIEVDADLVVNASADPAGGATGMTRLLELEPRPTAVFTVNNLVALGAIEAVRAAGLEVPDDVALVCFDDIEYASRLYPFLTAMEQPAQTFGTLSTQLLLDRIEGRSPQRPREVVLPGEFIVRKSCGATT